MVPVAMPTTDPYRPCGVQKLGEGQYGEVFSLERAGVRVAIKVSPFV